MAQHGKRSLRRPALTLRFRPIASEVCRIGVLEGAPPVTTTPAKRGMACIPRWLMPAHRAGEWGGEFGY